ncbi:MAG: class I SAM-dependent methyltransferase [Pseudomonadales bacterium]
MPDARGPHPGPHRGTGQLKPTRLPEDAHLATRQRFDSDGVAARYAAGKNLRDTWKNRREMYCIESALAGIPPGSRVLDLPTGSGRLLPMLLARGYDVLAADFSAHMLHQARALVAQHSASGSPISFVQTDVMRTGLPDRSVDVTICNRLLHHYPEAALRRRALSELARVTRERIVISYFSNWALSALRFHLKYFVQRRAPDDRIPIWPRVMAADIAAAGLEVTRRLSVRPGLSPQTYLVLRPAR